MKQRQIIPILQVLLAAGLFGASAPLSKLLLGEVQPLTLAGLLYLGCGIGAALLVVFRWRTRPSTEQAAKIEAGLARSDLIWLGGAILCGGICGPIL